MAKIYLSPSTQEYNPYVIGGGNEETNMNRLTDALAPYLDGTANYSISTVHDKEAWIVKMQPLPKYVLAKNRSYIKGIFWI